MEPQSAEGAGTKQDLEIICHRMSEIFHGISLNSVLREIILVPAAFASDMYMFAEK
jgi:hypothetical protein